jgi:ribosomal protein S27AE
MNKLTPEQKQKIIEVLNRKNVKLPCPRCGNNNFILADGYFNHPIQIDFTNFTFGGPSIPAVATFCSNCGFISEHALGVLNQLNDTKTNEWG